MTTKRIAFSLLLGAFFVSSTSAQCPIKDSIMGGGNPVMPSAAQPRLPTIGADDKVQLNEEQTNAGDEKESGHEDEYESFNHFRLGGSGEMVSAIKNYGIDRFSSSFGKPKERRATIAIPRFFLSLDYKFSPKWILGAEVEFENGGVGVSLDSDPPEHGKHETEVEKSGEVALEQFHLTRLIHPAFNVRVGHMIVPIGLINPHHEPVDFFGTVRPEGESTIIPCTWHETGLAFWGSLGRGLARFNYQTLLISGLDASRFNSKNWIRNGQQGRFEEDRLQCPAIVARVDWVGLSGLRAGASFYHCGDAGMNGDQPSAYKNKFPVNIFSIDAQYESPYVIARGNVLSGTVGNAHLLSQGSHEAQASASDFDQSSVARRALNYGGEVGLNLRNLVGNPQLPELIPFVRYEYYNAQQEVDKKGTRFSEMSTGMKTSMWVFGLNYRIGNGIVFKADYTTRRIGDEKLNSEKEFALGVAFNTWFLNQ